MNSERALVAVKEKPPTKGTVTTETFTDFLFGTQNFPHATWDFAPRLNLSTYTPAFRVLYEESQDVFVNSEAFRTSFRESRESFERLAKDHGITLQPDPENDEFLDQKDKAERSSVVFYNPGHNIYSFTDPVHGDYHSTTTEAIEVLNAGSTPLLEIHTHPDDSLPSFIDYSRLLWKPDGHNRSIVRGIAVLTPSQQILALPTDMTPQLSLERTLALTNQWDEKYSQTITPIYQYLGSKTTMIQNAVSNHTRRSLSEYAEFTNELLRRMHAGEFTKEQADEIAAEVREEMLAYTRYFSGYKREKVQYDLSVRFHKRKNYAENVLLTEFAREINVQLYTATDSVHFSRATA